MRKANEIALRRRKVAALLLTGKTQDAIAQALGVGKATISRDVKAIREQWSAEAEKDYKAWISEELAKLRGAENLVMESVLTGDVKTRNLSIDRLLHLMEHRAKLLGLYAPEKHHVVTEDALDAEIARLERELEALDT